jgi:pimeloyl-ACP methyl ester carboxylesterase
MALDRPHHQRPPPLGSARLTRITQPYHQGPQESRRYSAGDHPRAEPPDANADPATPPQLTHERSRLVIHHTDKLTGLPSLVVASEQDALTPPSRTIAIADFLKADHIVLGVDWGLPGFGHLMPIERGNELITERVLDWLAAKGI